MTEGQRPPIDFDAILEDVQGVQLAGRHAAGQLIAALQDVVVPEGSIAKGFDGDLDGVRWCAAVAPSGRSGKNSYFVQGPDATYVMRPLDGVAYAVTEQSEAEISKLPRDLQRKEMQREFEARHRVNAKDVEFLQAILPSVREAVQHDVSEGTKE